MSARKIFNAIITQGLHELIAGRLGSNRQGNMSDVVRAALPLLEERGLRSDQHRRTAIGAGKPDAR